MKTPAAFELRSPSPGESPALFAWLNEGLRNGAAERLEREFPNVAQNRDLGGHVLAVERGSFAAHALGHTTSVCAGRHRFELGMIGMVYTAPAQRGRGLARRCIETAIERTRQRGAGLCLLWSELDDFYRRLGFLRAGDEWFFWLARGELARAAADGPPLRVAAPQDADWSTLEALYESHSSRALRPPGALRRLAMSPDCDLRVAFRGSRGTRRAVAYAARGRGDDFPDIVHEWAGDPEAVLACLDALAEHRDWLGLLAPPSADAMVSALGRRGIQRAANDLAWFRVVDAALLWEQLCVNAPALAALRVAGGGNRVVCMGSEGGAQLDAPAFLQWLLRGEAPRALQHTLSPDAWRAVEGAFPVPLYLWGFDSV